jgi:hypothetical protein
LHPFTSPEQRADRNIDHSLQEGLLMPHPTSMRRRLVVTLVATVVALLATGSAATAQPAASSGTPANFLARPAA